MACAGGSAYPGCFIDRKIQIHNILHKKNNWFDLKRRDKGRIEHADHMVSPCKVPKCLLLVNLHVKPLTKNVFIKYGSIKNATLQDLL